MQSNMPDYSQGDIVWADYPLSNKPDKSKIRPVLIVSNSDSNSLDNDLIIVPITSKLRNQPFGIILTDDKLTSPLPTLSAVRCNKIHAIGKTRITGKIASLEREPLIEVVKTVYDTIRLLNDFKLRS